MTARIAQPSQRSFPMFSLGCWRRRRSRLASNATGRFIRGDENVVELAGTAMVPRPSDATAKRVQHQAASSGLFSRLDAVDAGQWRALADRAIEPNGYYLPDWELAVNASAPGRTGADALEARSDAALIGLMPVVSLSRAYKIPLPALVSAEPYGTLCTPLLDRASAEDAAAQIMQAARDA